MPKLIDYIQVRTDHSLFDAIEEFCGSSKSNRGIWSCPFPIHSPHSRGPSGSPSFKLSADGQRVKCWGACGWSGDLFDFIKATKNLNNDNQVLQTLGYTIDFGLSPQEFARRQAEIKQRNDTARIQRETENERIKADVGQRIAAKKPQALQYHENLKIFPQAVEYWHSEGFLDSTIATYQLGYCPKKLINFEQKIYSPTYTIPDFRNDILITLRHRIAIPEIAQEFGSYRSEFPGIPPQLFNVDRMIFNDDFGFESSQPEQMILVEGEKKSMLLNQWGFNVVGLPGLNTWNSDWLKFFKQASEIFICFDPDVDESLAANQSRNKVAADFVEDGKIVRIVSLPVKPDDYLFQWAGSIRGFNNFLRMGQRVE